MSYIGGPLPGKERDEEFPQDIGKETFQKAVAPVTEAIGGFYEEHKETIDPIARTLGTAWEGAKRIDNKYDPLEYVASGTAHAIEGAGKVYDKAIEGVSAVTGIYRGYFDVADFFIPFTPSALKAAKKFGKAKKVATVVDKVSDVSKGAQFAYKAQRLQPGFNTSFVDFLGESGERMFLKNSTNAEKVLKMTGAQGKTNKQLFFTDIYDPAFAAARKLDPSTRIPDKFAYTGAFHPTGIMGRLKPRKGGNFPGFNMSPHHFTIDDDLAYSVVSRVNKANQSEVVSILNDTYSIYPGNHPKNFMMSYHDNTALRNKQQIAQVNSFWDDYLAKNPNATEKRPSLKEITTLQKLPSEGKMIGGKASFNKPLGETLLEEIDMIKDVRTKGLDKKDWSSILPPGVKRSDLTFDPVVLGIDHQALIHGIGDRLPDRLKLIELSKTKKWAEMTPAAQAREIAKVSRQQQNVALRISGMRLKLIKKRMTELGKPIDDWTDIQAWMIQNPTEAASLNYHKILSEGVDIPMDVITKDLPLKEAQEIANVFNIEQVNKVGPALDARRAEVKAIKRDIQGE